MTDANQNKVFISYAWKDRDSVAEIATAVKNAGLDVWMDVEQIVPGKSISSSIVQGLESSDFYLIVISENSNASQWVSREIAMAIELADKQKLTPIPLLLKNVDVPLEFKGLLYIDARTSLKSGIDVLVEYLRSQRVTVGSLDNRRIIRKSGDAKSLERRACQDRLLALEAHELRFYLTNILSIADIQVLWFDLFGRKMEDEVHHARLNLSVIELIDRARREGRLPTLIDLICRNNPWFSISLDPV